MLSVAIIFVLFYAVNCLLLYYKMTLIVELVTTVTEDSAPCAVEVCNIIMLGEINVSYNIQYYKGY